MMLAPLLSLYIHLPWCVQKCPYCDFNSHALSKDVRENGIPEQEYINALLADLAQDLAQFDTNSRPLHSIFIGGGTPSLFSPQSIKQLLNGIQAQIAFSDEIEITMEANPGAVEASQFTAYQKAGITRLSIGVQSFNDAHLARLGRIHSAADARQAIKLALQAGFDSVNIDLMHGLPEQTPSEALADLAEAIALEPTHLSWYQLTIEPNTLYHAKPPTLPNDDDLWQIYRQGNALLGAAGYQQYETSGYAKAGYQCQHNLNYWRFGDYLGIGCGAHGKITQPTKKPLIDSTKNLISEVDSAIYRSVKIKHPRGYLLPNANPLASLEAVPKNELAFEYALNRFRLFEPCLKAEFTERTGLPLSSISPAIARAIEQGWLTETTSHWQITEQGRLFLNDLLSEFI